MKRMRGVFLLLAGLLVLWPLVGRRLAADAAVCVIGFAAALAVASVVAGGLCFLVRCSAPGVSATALGRVSFLAKNLTKAVSAALSDGRSTRQTTARPTQAGQP